MPQSQRENVVMKLNEKIYEFVDDMNRHMQEIPNGMQLEFNDALSSLCRVVVALEHADRMKTDDRQVKSSNASTNNLNNREQLERTYRRLCDIPQDDDHMYDQT